MDIIAELNKEFDLTGKLQLGKKKFD